MNLGLTSEGRQGDRQAPPALKVTVDGTGGGVKQTATGTLTR